MKKLFFLAMLPLALALLSFMEDCPRTEIVKLDNGNYIAEEPVYISPDDEAALDELLSIDPDLAERGFFWSCYTKTDCKWQHGRIWGGGCCTSEPVAASAESIEIANDVRTEIDAIMERYMY